MGLTALHVVTENAQVLLRVACADGWARWAAVALKGRRRGELRVYRVNPIVGQIIREDTGAEYLVSPEGGLCTCRAGFRPDCVHRKIMRAERSLPR